MRRLFSTTTLLPIWLALAPACSVVNTDHCGNREGDATCAQQGDAIPYCSICIADNNGCVAAVPEDRCLATTAAATSPGSSSTVDPGTTEPTTTGLTDTGSTSTPGTTTTGDPGTSSDTSTSTMSPMCGDNMVEGNEVCDGSNNDGETCKSVVPNKWGGGTLQCNPNCQSFNDTKCCIGVGQDCELINPQGTCCAPLTCKVEGLGGVCKN